MQRTLITIASCLWILLAVPNGFASLDAGFKALFHNDLGQAKSELESSLNSTDDETARQGLFLLAWAEGDSPEMVRILSELIAAHPRSPYLPAYLALSGFPNMQGWEPSEFTKMLETVLEGELPPTSSQPLSFRLMELRDVLLDRRAKESADDAGVLTDHWQTVGPFGRYGAADYFRSFGPENEITRRYAGWQKEIEIHPIDTPDATGLVDLDTLVSPAMGVAYALNVIEVDSGSNALLTVESPAGFRVWLDGEPVMEKSHLLLHTSKAVTKRIELGQGKHLLVVKSMRSGGWWLRASLQAVPGQELDFRTLPFDIGEFSDLALVPFQVRYPVAQESQGLISDYPFETVPDNGPEAVKHILLAAYSIDRFEYDQAKTLIRKAIDSEPEFALLHSILGSVLLHQANARPGSKSRFHQEAETAFQKALELNPLSRNTVIGLQTYYLDRDQIDRALEIVDENVNKHPELMTDGYTGLLSYAYGVLYSRKGFSAESARAYERSKETFIPSLSVYSHLFNYYNRRNHTARAAKLAAEALDRYPGYTPFLEMASRIDPSAPGAPDIIPILKRGMELHPHALRYVFTLGRTLERRGQLDEMRKLYATLREKYPEHVSIAETEGKLAYLASDRGAALEAYQAAYDRSPSRMTPFRALRDAGDQQDFPYQAYDVQLDDIDVTQADIWENTRASSIFLLDIMVMELHENGTYDQYIHQAIKILNQEGMNKWDEIVIPRGGNVEVLMGRTIAPDGTEWALSDVQNLNRDQSLSMYGIEEGTIIEYAYLQRTGRSEPGVNITGGGYYFGSEDDPMLLSKLTVVRSENVPFNLDTNPHDFAPKITRLKDRLIYEWEKRMSPGIKRESSPPPLSKRVPAVQWTTSPGWLPFVEMQRTSITGYEEACPEIDRLFNQLKEQSSSKQDYVERVYEWIRTKIEETSGGLTTADTVILGAGSGYQKMRLARHLLRKHGIESQMVLALENDTKDGYRPMPSLNYPGRMLLAIPRQNEISERLFMDFSSRFAALDSVESSVRKMVAFHFDGPVPYFDPLEPSLWDQGRLFRDIHLTLRDDRSASVKGNYFYGNMYDRMIRERLTDPEFKQRLPDLQLSSDLTGIQVEERELKDVDALALPLRLVFSGTIPDIAKKATANGLKIKPVLMRSEAAALVSEPKREFPIVYNSSPIYDPLALRYDLSHYIDRDASIQIPENTLLLTEYGYYSLFYDWEGTELVVRRSFIIPAQEIKPEDYAGFIDFCRAIDQAEDREISIVFPS